HPLLVREGYHVLDVVMVLLEPLVERMLAKGLALFFEIGAGPGEAQTMGLLDEFIVGATRCREGLKQAGGNPGIVLQDVRLDNDGMHDRKNLRLPVIVTLVLLKVREQTLHGAPAPNPRFR